MDRDPGPGLGYLEGQREWKPHQGPEDLGTETQTQDWGRSRALCLNLI